MLAVASIVVELVFVILNTSITLAVVSVVVKMVCHQIVILTNLPPVLYQ